MGWAICRNIGSCLITFQFIINIKKSIKPNGSFFPPDRYHLEEYSADKQTVTSDLNPEANQQVHIDEPGHTQSENKVKVRAGELVS